MFKYRFFQVVMALSLVLLIISTALMCSFSVCRVTEKSYSPSGGDTINAVMNNGQTEELSDFDAWVEYCIVLDGLDGDSEQEYRLGNIYLSTENVIRLEQLADIKSKASNGVFISIVLLVACFVVIRRRRLYECVVWGGAAGVIIGIISFIAMTMSGGGIMYGIRRMVFDGSYKELLPGHDVLPDIIPAGTGTKVLWVYVGTIFVGLVVTIAVRVISYKRSRPHKFR